MRRWAEHPDSQGSWDDEAELRHRNLVAGEDGVCRHALCGRDHVRKSGWRFAVRASARPFVGCTRLVQPNRRRVAMVAARQLPSVAMRWGSMCKPEPVDPGGDRTRGI